MKKVKIMLTAIGVLSIVGGALAFKARVIGSDDYCIKGTCGGTCICTSFVNNASFQAGGAPLLGYTITNNTANCNSGNVSCPNCGRMVQ